MTSDDTFVAKKSVTSLMTIQNQIPIETIQKSLLKSLTLVLSISTASQNTPKNCTTCWVS